MERNYFEKIDRNDITSKGDVQTTIVCDISKKSRKKMPKGTRFPKIHRSVLCKITIDLFYFWDVYDVNLREKISAYSCRTNVFI